MLAATPLWELDRRIFPGRFIVKIIQHISFFFVNLDERYMLTKTEKAKSTLSLQSDIVFLPSYFLSRELMIQVEEM